MTRRTTSNGSNDDRRNAPRASVALIIEYASLEQFCQDYARNLSLGGIFIETRTPLPVGASLELSFSLPESAELIKSTGRVVRTVTAEQAANLEGRPGMAVQFEDLSEAHKRVIDQLVQASLEVD